MQEPGSLGNYLLKVHGQALRGDLQDPGVGVLEGGQPPPQGLQARAVCRERDTSRESGEWSGSHHNLRTTSQGAASQAPAGETEAQRGEVGTQSRAFPDTGAAQSHK